MISFQTAIPSLLAEKGKALGFIAVGFSRPERPPHIDHFYRWLSENKYAEMSWLKRNLEIREDPTKLLTGCRTILSLAYPYPSHKPGTPDGYSMARYSDPTEVDYHQRLKRLCGEMCRMIEEMVPGSKTRVCVDSSPILERSLAYAAGIGFVGKNNMLIIPGYGSFFYLAEIVTTAFLEFPPLHPIEDGCGACMSCVESCPTGALERPFQINASRCLSYMTIEHKGPLEEGIGRRMGDCFLGCDQCQEACPFNGDRSSREVLLPSTEAYLNLAFDEFKGRFGKTALARAGLEKIKTNIRAIRRSRRNGLETQIKGLL